MTKGENGTGKASTGPGKQQRAAVVLYYVALVAFSVSLLANQPDYFANDRWNLVIIDALTLAVIYLSLLLYLKKKLPFRNCAIVFVYGTVINLSCSVWYYHYNNIFLSGNFLLHTFIFSIYLVLAGFCIGRRHIYIVAGIYITAYIPLVFISGDEFLRKNILTIPFLIVVYAFAVSMLIYLLDKSHKKEMELQKAVNENNSLLVEKQNEWLNCQLEARKREIVLNSMFLLEHVQNNNDFIDKLSFLKEKLNDSDRVVLQGIIDDHRSEHFSKHWKDFETSFLEVNPDFYRNLSKVCPDLSPMQRKLAALIKLGLSSKQIGSITSISTQSVEVARSRLRARLNLTADTGLTNFLQSL